MTAWNIHPQQVFGVLSGVSEHIGDEDGTYGLTGHMTSLETHLNEANSAANSDPVGVALSEFAEHYFTEVGDMVAKSASAVEGAGEATMHYVNGNLQMAEEAQANAGEIP
ncbi:MULTISPECIES: DUF6507 family protein [unclassified Nocardiopsis]|uniref:DUF6507 family protein n=1 Tax=unclassified Nocardiopsis TaxID=2649073 RepID=UPI001357A46F|nr:MULTISPECIES: DUF6507 family protein [unclassified Nocardiopsis]